MQEVNVASPPQRTRPLEVRPKGARKARLQAGQRCLTHGVGLSVVRQFWSVTKQPSDRIPHLNLFFPHISSCEHQTFTRRQAAVLHILSRPATVSPAMGWCRIGAVPDSALVRPLASIGAVAPVSPGRPAPGHRWTGSSLAGLGLGISPGADQAAVCRGRGAAGPAPALLSPSTGLGAGAPGAPASPASVH